MRLQALRARPRRRRLPPDLGDRQASAVAPNVLDRTFEASGPNRKWIADFTYIWTADGWLYAAAVVDLFSRRVVGWSMSATMTAQLVTDALIMAIWRRGKPDALLHRSDRGSQYTSEQFQRLPELGYPFHDKEILVTACGRICLHRKKINLSTVFAGQTVGIKEIDDAVWLVSFMHYDLGYIDLEQRTLQPLDNPFGPSLSPMS